MKTDRNEQQGYKMHSIHGIEFEAGAGRSFLPQMMNTFLAVELSVN